jgi:hypothetical protein
LSHIPTTHLHAYRNRGLDLRILIDTAAVAADLTDVTFRVGDVIGKTGLTPADLTGDVAIDLTVTAADMDVPVGVYRWECLATVTGEVRTVAQGRFTVGSEPSTTPAYTGTSAVSQENDTATVTGTFTP